MGGDEPTRTAALAREVRADLEDWAARYPLVRRTRFPGIALTAAVQLPELGRADRALAGLVAAWLFTFDDVVDEERVAGPALAALVADLKAIAWRAPPAVGAGGSEPGAQMGRALTEIRERLAAYRSFASLADHWRLTFAQAVDGIVRDRILGTALRGAAPGAPRPAPPSYATVMATAQYSIAAHHYLASCLVVYNDPRVVARLPALAAIGTECARAVRLANDLQTWEKEEREGIFNTLAAARAELLRAEPGLSAAEGQERALRFARERLAAHAAHTRALLAVSPVPDGAVEAGLARFLDFTTGFYAAHDFHTFRQEEHQS